MYEHGTLWGYEIGLKYGYPAEDIITGLAIHCRGWMSVHNNPPRPAFLGVAPTTLAQRHLLVPRGKMIHTTTLVRKASF
jgi:hypothetical protein